MDTKKFLKQLKYVDDLISANAEEIVCLEGIGTSASSGQLHTAPVKQARECDKVSDTATTVTDLQNEMALQIVHLILMKKRANAILKKVKPIQLQTMLMKYYFQNKTLEQTAAEMKVSYQWVCELHTRALAEFQKHTPNGYLDIGEDTIKRYVSREGGGD